MKVLLLSRYGRLGASSRLRSYQYLPYLTAHGIEVTVAPLLEDEYILSLYAGSRKDWGAIFAAYQRRLRHLLRSRSFDMVWFEYELFPMLPAWAESALRRLRVSTVVDYDDAVFHRYDRHSNRWVRRILGRKIDTVMGTATLVVAGNGYLAERARAAGACWVEQLPTVIDLECYTPPAKISGTPYAVGRIGSPATVKYLGLIRGPLQVLCRDGDAILVTIVAAPVNSDGLKVEQWAWTEETEVDCLHHLNVGIMPLPDTPFERGKCGYKLIQYMACGLPVVASPVGVNCEIVEHGLNGFLAQTEEEWIKALSTLRDSPDLRARLGAAGRRKIEEHYCVQVTAPRLHGILCEAAAQGRHD